MDEVDDQEQEEGIPVEAEEVLVAGLEEGMEAEEVLAIMELGGSRNHKHAFWG